MAWLLRSATNPATSMTATAGRLPSTPRARAPKLDHSRAARGRPLRSREMTSDRRAPALDDPALDVFHHVADEVARRLGATSDWSFSGTRDGQYAVDVDVDRIAVSILLDAGFAVL